MPSDWDESRTSFKLTVPADASYVTLQGHFAVTGGSGNDVEVYMLPEDGFTNWENRHSATPQDHALPGVVERLADGTESRR
jgi:hypothetical protein